MQTLQLALLFRLPFGGHQRHPLGHRSVMATAPAPWDGEMTRALATPKLKRLQMRQSGPCAEGVSLAAQRTKAYQGVCGQHREAWSRHRSESRNCHAVTGNAQSFMALARKQAKGTAAKHGYFHWVIPHRPRSFSATEKAGGKALGPPKCPLRLPAKMDLPSIGFRG